MKERRETTGFFGARRYIAGARRAFREMCAEPGRPTTEEMVLASLRLHGRGGRLERTIKDLPVPMKMGLVGLGAWAHELAGLATEEGARYSAEQAERCFMVMAAKDKEQGAFIGRLPPGVQTKRGLCGRFVTTKRGLSRGSRPGCRTTSALITTRRWRFHVRAA